MVVFPHRLLHESKSVTKGFKFMIRSDVMYDLVKVDGKEVKAAENIYDHKGAKKDDSSSKEDTSAPRM